VIENHLSSFLAPSSNHQTKVIGFDAEWFMYNQLPAGPVFFRPKCATIQLCDGHSCLIIQLNYLESYNSLVNFLSLPNITFVGVGIKENLARLEKYYGIGCKNAVELGPLAATVMNMPRLSLCGVDELAFVVNGFDLQDHRPVTTSHNYVARYLLSRELAKVAVVNVYCYQKIGAKLVFFSFDSNLFCFCFIAVFIYFHSCINFCLFHILIHIFVLIHLHILIFPQS
jgi:hypothetical protein